MVNRAHLKNSTSNAPPPRAATLQYLRASEVCALLRISRPTLWRLRRDGEFPAPTALSRRSIGWRQSDVEQWLRERTPEDPRPCAPSMRAQSPNAPHPELRREMGTAHTPSATRPPAQREPQLDIPFGRGVAG